MTYKKVRADSTINYVIVQQLMR